MQCHEILDIANRVLEDTVVEQPVCERCHALKHHEIGVSIHHPSIQSIEDTILESPHKYNHIYHVIDAADFPMSLVPGLNKLLNITPLRSLNRRSKTGKFFKGKKTELSFIITRSDLLAPKKEQVDSMMPYLRDVLRTALGRVATDVRLGNLRCVSAKRGWWTKEMKEDIWTRGGGGWMVGKVNVGKSQLFHEIYPKGRRGKVDYGPKLTPAQKKDTDWRSVTVSAEEEEVEAPALFGKNMAFKPIAAQEEELERASMAKELEATEEDDVEDDDFSASELSLLPPAQIEEDYPAMPLVSALPGTTASPIRVPFGNGKGELIDLPGMARGDLELHVQEEHRTSLVMRSRVRPEQKTIKPGQSLLLGGFIRITPTTPDLIFLSYSFNPLKPHVTSTEKAIGTQTQERESSVEDISIPGTGEKIKSAGTFHLKWDVTKLRTGPITARDAAKIHVDRLPYRVMAADILIEGCGWVELVAQIRKPYGHAPHKNYESKPQTNYNGIEERPLETNAWGWGVKDDTKKEPERRKEKEEEAKEKEEVDPTWPAVEVFTPDGKFAAVRQPMNAWMMCAKKPSEKAAHGRPRRSMKGMKKLGKIRARAAAAAAV